MTTIRTLVTAGVVLAGLTLVGCGRTTSLRIDNPTDEILPVVVQIVGSGHRPEPRGRIAPNGGRLVTKVRVKNKELPAQVMVRVGLFNPRSFTVTKTSPKIVWMHVSLDGQRLEKRGEGPVSEERTVDVEVEVGGPTEVIE